MRPRKLLSVGVVSLLVVLASATGVAFTAQQTTPTASDTANADLSGVLAQQDSPDPTTAETEPNDDRANATPLTNVGVGSNGQFVGGNAYGNLTDEANESADVDFFSFNVTAGQAINLYSQGSNLPDEAVSGDFDGVDLTLYNPSGEAVASTGSGPGDIFTTGTVATETGTYYVRVNDSFDSDGNAYDFGFEVADPDAFEPNDDTDTATPIESGEGVNGTVTTDDVDVFAVDADAGQTVAAAVELGSLPTDNPGNVRVDVLDENGDRISETDAGTYPSNETVLTGADGKDTASANATVDEAGTYYVRVAGVTDTGGVDDVQGFVPYELDVAVNGTASTTTPTETATQTSTETQSAAMSTTADETTTETSSTAMATTAETATATASATTETSTTSETTIETSTTAATATETATEDPSAAATTAYYQVDFVTGEAIENLRSDEGYYTPDRLIRFAHGDTDAGVTRVSDGEFVTDETTADRIESENITVENGTATITFTVNEGEPIDLTLASYEKTGPGWSPETESQQRFVDADTRTFESGTHTLTVDLPGTATDSTTESGPTVVNAAGTDDDGLSAAEILDRANQSYQSVSDVTANYETDSDVTYRGTQYYERNASAAFTFKAPNQTRYDFTNGSVYVDNGNTSTFYNASNDSATIYPNYRAHGIVDGIDNQSYLGSYLDLVNQSNTVVYEGTTEVEGGDAYVFSLTPAYDFGAYYTESTTLYLDTETYLPLGSDYVGTYGNASNGTNVDYSVNTRYSDLQVNTGVSDDEFNISIPDGTTVTDYGFYNYTYVEYDSFEAAQQATSYTIPQPTDLPEGYSFENASVWSYPPTTYTAGSPVENLSDVDLYYSDGTDTIGVYMYQLPESGVFYGFGKETPVNGQAGYFESYDGFGYLNFACGDLDYSVSGPLSRSDLVTIGESVTCEVDSSATNATTA